MFDWRSGELLLLEELVFGHKSTKWVVWGWASVKYKWIFKKSCKVKRSAEEDSQKEFLSGIYLYT